MVRLIFILYLISFKVSSTELSKQELVYFNILDLNNDKLISLEEINQTTDILIQLLDVNQDNKISISELEELKNIIEFLK